MHEAKLFASSMDEVHHGEFAHKLETTPWIRETWDDGTVYRHAGGLHQPFAVELSDGTFHVKKHRVVVCAAIRSKEGKIVCGARHWDSVMRGQVLVDGKRPKEWLSAEQGFIDQFGVFMDRQEAWVVAENGEQIKRHTGTPGTLYSEDLY